MRLNHIYAEVATVIILLIALVTMRFITIRSDIRFDKETTSADDFAVLVTNMAARTPADPKIFVRYFRQFGSVKSVALATPGSSCLLYTSPSPRDGLLSRMPSSA